MKKLSKMFSIFLMATLAASVASCKKDNKEQDNPPQEQEEIVIEKHLILDSDGNYGGNYNINTYGKGAPLNGEYDVEDSEYYAVNDYYNIHSTDTRTVLSYFQPYQQTMKYSDGIACAMMMLNYMETPLEGDYTEEKLVQKYESLAGTSLKTKESSVDGMMKLFDNLGLEAVDYPFIPSSTNKGTRVVEFTEFIEEQLSEDNFVMVRYQDGLDFRWHIVIGVDHMGENMKYHMRDNIMIMADPCDDSDHFQDGYSISATARFMTWWLKQGTSSTSNELECISIHSTKPFDISRDSKDPVKTNKPAPERHLLTNLDGSFGGTLDNNLYGCVEEINGFVDPEYTGLEYEDTGSIEHTEYNYFAYPDYYNMEDTDSRLILTGFRSFEQTEASSCGICSVLNTLIYYDHDFSQIHKNSHILNRENLFLVKKAKPTTSGGLKYNYWNSEKTDVFGPIDDEDNGRKQEALTLIYMDQDSAFKDGTKLFNNYGGVGATKLINVPKALGYTNSKATNSSSYHGVFKTYDNFVTWVKTNLNKDQSMCTGWCPVSGHWTTIMGYDDMGTDFIYDDVIIIADSHDVSDHYQDGYNTYPATMFWGQWRNGGGSVYEQYVVVERK